APEGARGAPGRAARGLHPQGSGRLLPRGDRTPHRDRRRRIGEQAAPCQEHAEGQTEGLRMNRIFGHPTFVALSRYADGELDSRRRARVASHLVRCARCRETVDFIHALGEAARSLPAPEPPADAVERVLARRASGERVILPTADPVPLETGRGRIGPLVAATVAALIAAAVLVTVPRLDAERSRL